MTNKKISELTELVTPSSTDIVPIVSAGETKKITVGNLIGDKYVRTTRFAIISSGTSGTVTLPSNSEVVLDDFGGTVDAVVSQVSGGLPTLISAKSSSGTVIATSFNSSGNWSFTGTPVTYPVAILYRVRQKLLDLDSTSSNIWGNSNVEQITKADIGLGNVDNVSVANILKPRRVKKTANIRLDTPSPNPIIAPGASHTYVIDLGETYTQIALTNFQWVQPSISLSDPDAVLATAAFPHEVYGGVLIATTEPKGWLRCFEINSPEFQNGVGTDVDASYSADNDEVDAPLGYGSSPLEVPLDHIALETSPPKKLQIEDVYLDGSNLKVIIKNYDSVSIDLSQYVGVTALFDEERTADMGAISENGNLAYTSFNGGAVRISEDGGKTFRTSFPTGVPPSSVAPLATSIAMTNDSVNTFIGLFNYAYVQVAESPDYIFQNRFHVRGISNFESNFYGPLGGNTFPVAGKTFDWKKTDTDSCALFAGFMGYYSIQVYKSVDDCYNFGNNSPTFDNKLPIFNSDGLTTSDLPDFLESRPPNNRFNFLKSQVKVIDESIHYLSLSYWAKPESFFNGTGMPDVFVGPQTITGDLSVPWELRAGDIAFSGFSFFNSAFGTMRITGSTLGNNGDGSTFTSGWSTQMPVYYYGNWNSSAVAANAVIQNMTFTAATAGWAGNSFSIEIVGGGTQGSETVNRTGNVFTITIEDTVSTCQDIANAWTDTDVTINVTGFETNTVTTSSSQNLANGLDAIVMAPNEMAVLKTEWDTYTTQTINGNPYPAVVGDTIQTYVVSTGIVISGLRNLTINGVLYKIVGHARTTLGSVEPINFFTGQGNNGSPIPNEFVQHKIGEAIWYINGKSYRQWTFSDKTMVAEASPSANPASTSPNLKASFIMQSSTQKNKLLKTTDGGATWSSIMEHEEFRYSPACVFHSSNDGQTLLLASLKYWTGVAHEKWPYPSNPSEMGSYARFNISTDGGATWRNASGSWDYVGKNMVNVQVSTDGPNYGGRPTNGQVMGRVSGEILLIVYNDNLLPVLYRSTDNGLTWNNPVILKIPSVSTSDGMRAYSSDAKDAFMGFFGRYYATNQDQYVYYGALVDSFTSWKGFGVK